MAGVPSIGDILMLSQVAWKIGRAFTAGRKGAPAEFQEVESEVSGLAKALKLLAETLFADNAASDGDSKGGGSNGSGILAQAGAETRNGVEIILQSCQQTLKDLESLVEQYQVIKRHRTSGGFSIERSWSDLVLTNYRKMMWTTEGGNIQALRNMLHMHTSTITLTMQALQSKSLARLEEIVHPMAEKVDEIHSAVTGDLSDKIQDVHAIVLAIAGASPTLAAVRDSRLLDITPLESPLLDPMPEALRLGYSHSIRSSNSIRSSVTPQRSPEIQPLDSRHFSSPGRRYSRRESDLSTAPSLSDSDRRSSGGAFPTRQSSLAGASSPGSPNGGSARRPSNGWRRIDDASELPTVRDADEAAEEQQQPPLSPRSPPQSHRADSITWPVLPSPAIPPDPDPGSVAKRLSRLSLGPPVAVPPDDSLEKILVERKLERSATIGSIGTFATSASQQEAFEKAAFRDSAILCELRGKQVEYLQPPKDEMMPLDVEMGDAMGACRVLVVRKRDFRADGSLRMVTSIWSMSDDGTVRMQQKLADGVEIVPHASYFVPEKISLPLVTELKFHDAPFGSRSKTVKTTWVNYVFEDVKTATLFQNELMGKKLVGVFKTEKTLRIHEGLTGVLAYQEQMCGMENLRLWADPDNGGILAMIHFSAHFRPGYLAFYLNSSACPVRVKDEGGKEVKIKGLRIPLDRDKAGVGGRRGSEAGKAEGKKWISGAKVEFATDIEKFLFLEKVKEVQETMIRLPDV